MDAFRKQVEQLFNIELTGQQLNQFQAYERILLDWNKKINLTAIDTPEEVQRKHFIDSMNCIKAWDKTTIPSTCIDVGTGAGFPGIVLKIVYPSIEMTLVESIKKKALFCETVIRDLSLVSMYVVNERAESICRLPQYSFQFDCAVARAVSPLITLCDYTVPFIKKNGSVIAMKGKNVDQEISESSQVFLQKKLRISKIIPYTLPLETEERKLLLIQRT
jgi:16S rRNA (guanine527-N7)-methyltransferase